jgi:hypothetical protein
VVDVQQVTVQVHVLVLSNLHGSIGFYWRDLARREAHPSKQAKRRYSDLGETLGRELGIIDDDLLDVWVRRLRPVGLERCHVEVVWDDDSGALRCFGKLLKNNCLKIFGDGTQQHVPRSQEEL